VLGVAAVAAVASYEEATVLAERAAHHAALDNPRGVAWLLGRLRTAGLQEQVTAFTNRLSAAGMFELFCEVQAASMSSGMAVGLMALLPNHGNGRTWTNGKPAD
jgi:hypothetical protein